MFCPSDATDSLEDHITADGRLTLVNKVRGNRQEGVEAIDASYTYVPWLLDRVSDNDPKAFSLRLFHIADMIGLSDEDSIDFAEGPAQLLATTHALFTTLRRARASNDPAAFRGLADSDITLPPDDEYGPGNGNAGGNTVARLRQGIERFLITDINNPAASAKAASNIFVMYDNVAVSTEAFNHVPGGSNVLYMDGHVEFVKYPGPAPVNMKMAAIMRMFDRRGPH